MSNEFYNRKYSVQVEDFLITEHDIRFRAIRTGKTKEPNTLELDVFNLGKDARAQLQERKSSRLLQLEAGYENKSGVIFFGDVRDIMSYYNPSLKSWVTRFESGDGEEATRFSRINKSYAKGTPLQKVVEDLAASMEGVGLGNLKQAIAQAKLPGGGDTYVNGITVSGNTSKALDRIIRSAGLQWSIQNQQFQILAAAETLNDITVELDSNKGMIGSPTLGSDGVLNVTSLMNSDIIPGRQLKVKSKSVSNVDFKAVRCEYVGESIGQNWYVQTEAEEFDTFLASLDAAI